MVKFESLHAIWIREEKKGLGHFRDSTWFLGEITRPVEEEMGAVIVCNKVWEWCQFLISSEISQSFLVNEALLDVI